MFFAISFLFIFFTNNPDFPSDTTSLLPPGLSVVTMGRPKAWDSIRTLGNPSNFDVSVNTLQYLKYLYGLDEKPRNLIFPDKFIEHNSSEKQYKEIEMDYNSIEKKILSIIAPEEINLKAIKNI